MSSSNPEYVLAIHQSGLESTPDKKGVTMTPDAFQRNRAGIDLINELQAGRAKVRAIILGGGQVYPEYPALSEFAQAYMESNGVHLPIIHADSLNTVEDTDTIRFILKQMGVDSAITISTKSHLSARVYTFLTNLRHQINGVHLQFMAAEDIRRRNHQDSGEVLADVRNFENSDTNRRVGLTQMGLAALLLLPGFGRKKYLELAEKTLTARAVIN